MNTTIQKSVWPANIRPG